CVGSTKRIVRIEQNDLSLHTEVDAFVDVQRQKRAILFLTNAIVDLLSCVSVLNSSLLCPHPRIPPLCQAVRIVIDPVVVARTEERMFARKTQMPLEVHSERPPRSRGR